MNIKNNKAKTSLVIPILIITIICTITAILFILNSSSNDGAKDKKEDINVEETMQLANCTISHDDKYGGVYFNCSISDFNNIGFEFGDSVNVKFSNNYSVQDIPYYNGYYTETGGTLLVGYPGTDYIKLGINYGDDIWFISNVDENITATISLNEKAKYLDIQTSRDIHYSNEQGTLDDETFANFRAISVGNMKENFVYRGASPIDNKHNRAPVVDRLISNAKIKYVVDLADSDDEINEFRNKEDFNSRYFASLYDSKKVCVLSMSMSYKSDDFSDKMVRGLYDMANNNGPYYIHCQEGKDRTGFFCMILDSLAGATYDEIVDDYMKTYENYYGISKENEAEKYAVIRETNIDEMILYISRERKGYDFSKANMSKIAEEYLLRIGLELEDINLLKTKITK